jgi:hypothetical protein
VTAITASLVVSRSDSFDDRSPRYLLKHDNSSVVSIKVVHDDYRLLVKGGIDIVGSLLGLLLFAPFMLAIALAIRLTSPGPAIFTQERPDYGQRPFRMHKFRTMVPDAEKLQTNLESSNEAQGPVFEIRNDSRIAPIERIVQQDIFRRIAAAIQRAPRLAVARRATPASDPRRPEIRRRGANAALQREAGFNLHVAD